ncbi:MAG: Phytoene synthase [uncultured Rubrobacteraceae bacterium]|uniref:Phytoene synthase n=1 Tax=uncultured Rubrobacteraceae bacterium TaxID=349277 RepID=A0A6J4QX06_9ACTN|nr:MAG: Phytoene synthase [uncultured Rubrobacteraceae bacterium]
MRLDPVRGGPLADNSLALPECYELCRRIHKGHSRTYYFSTSLFPKEIRPRVHALYAFMRYADELVDNPGVTTLDQQLANLEAFEKETLSAMAGRAVPNPVLRAFGHTTMLCGIDAGLMKAFMKSMKMDTHVFRYPAYDDLQEYVYGSAAVVGLMMCRVVGVRSEEATPHAEALGVAMQLTNFLRDIKEDWARGRVYLPLEDLDHFGYSEEELGRGVVDERFVALMRFEVARARKLYRTADAGMRYIPRGRRYPVVVARRLYEAILDRIEAQGYDVFARRAETSLSYKLRVAAACAWGNPEEFSARLMLSKPGRLGLPSR